MFPYAMAKTRMSFPSRQRVSWCGWDRSFAHVEVDYMTGRAEPAEVVAALEAIAQPVAQ